MIVSAHPDLGGDFGSALAHWENRPFPPPFFYADRRQASLLALKNSNGSKSENNNTTTLPVRKLDEKEDRSSASGEDLSPAAGGLTNDVNDEVEVEDDDGVFPPHCSRAIVTLSQSSTREK